MGNRSLEWIVQINIKVQNPPEFQNKGNTIALNSRQLCLYVFVIKFCCFLLVSGFFLSLQLLLFCFFAPLYGIKQAVVFMLFVHALLFLH